MTDEINTNEVPADMDAQMKMRFALLPADLQKVITDSQYENELFAIAKANKLTFEHLETLQLETFMTLMGMNTPKEYRDFLKTELKKSDAEMDVIISAINEKIFNPVRASLDSLYEMEEVVDDTEESRGFVPSSDSVVSASVTQSIPQSPATVVPIRTTPTLAQPAPTMRPQYVSPVQNSVPVAGSVLTSVETSVLGKAGVVLGQDNMSQNKIDESSLPNRVDLMDGIENPVRTPSATIVANKLSMSTTPMPNKTTDYSLPRTTPQNVPQSTQKSGDPYRETV